MKRFFAAFGMMALLLGLAASCAKKTPEEQLQDARDALQKRDPIGAIVLAQKILKENTTGPVALQARGLLVDCYTADGNYVQARRVLNEIIDTVGLNSPEGQRAAFVKLRTYEVVRNRPLAIQQVVNFLEAATTGTTFWGHLKLRHAIYLMADDQGTTAAPILDEVFTNKKIKDEGLLRDTLSLLSDAYGTTETAATGIEYFQAYLDDTPTTNLVPLVYMVMGGLSRVLEKEKQANQYFERGFSAFDNLYERATGADRKMLILQRHARALSYKGDVDRAAKLLNKGIGEFRSHPNRIGLHYELAQLYMDNRRSTEAIKVCRQIAVEFHGDDRRVDALFLVGDILLRDKKYDEAAEEYKRIAARYPNTRIAYNAFGRMSQVRDLRLRDAATSTPVVFDLGLTSPTVKAAPTTTGAIPGAVPTTGTAPSDPAPTSPSVTGK